MKHLALALVIIALLSAFKFCVKEAAPFVAVWPAFMATLSLVWLLEGDRRK